MDPSPKITSRPNRRNRSQEESAFAIWLQRAWSFFVRKEIAGILCLIGGAVLILSPSTIALAEPSRSWFITPFFNIDAIQTTASILVIIMVLFLGLGLEKISSGNRRRVFRRHTQTIAVALMVTSVSIAIFAWAAFHFFLPVSRVSLSVGQSVQSLPMHHVLGRTKVMLPMATSVKEINIGQESVDLLFKKMDDEEGVKETIHAGDPIVAGNYRFALLGFEYSEQHLQASLSTIGENAVQQVSAIGGEVRFTLKGDEPLKVVAIVKNYLGVLGPAVQLESEKTGQFWVFQRGPTNPLMSNNIKVDVVETAPLAVLAVSDSRATDAISPMGVVFLVGLLVFVGVKKEDEDEVSS